MTNFIYDSILQTVLKVPRAMDEEQTPENSARIVQR